MGVTLDTGALIAFERGDASVRQLLGSYLRLGRLPTIPAVALAQAWRDGRRQARLARLLRSSSVEELDEALARRGGELMHRTACSDVADAVVAASAARRGDIVLTSDPNDLQRLADDLGTIRIVAI